MKYLIVDRNGSRDYLCENETALRDFAEEMLHEYYEIDGACDYGNPIDALFGYVSENDIPSLIENYNYSIFDEQHTFGDYAFDVVAKAVLTAYVQAKNSGYQFSIRKSVYDILGDYNDPKYDSVWHDGTIFELERGDIKIEFVSTGDIECVILDSDGNETNKEIGDFKGDNDLYHNDNYTINFNLNNWYEIQVSKNGDLIACDCTEFDLHDALLNIDELINWAKSVYKSFDL